MYAPMIACDRGVRRRSGRGMRRGHRRGERVLLGWRRPRRQRPPRRRHQAHARRARRRARRERPAVGGAARGADRHHRRRERSGGRRRHGDRARVRPAHRRRVRGVHRRLGAARVLRRLRRWLAARPTGRRGAGARDPRQQPHGRRRRSARARHGRAGGARRRVRRRVARLGGHLRRRPADRDRLHEAEHRERVDDVARRCDRRRVDAAGADARRPPTTAKRCGPGSTSAPRSSVRDGLLADREAAVDADDGAGGEAGRRAGEEQRGADDLGGVAGAAERVVGRLALPPASTPSRCR